MTFNYTHTECMFWFTGLRETTVYNACTGVTKTLPSGLDWVPYVTGGVVGLAIVVWIGFHIVREFF